MAEEKIITLDSLEKQINDYKKEDYQKKVDIASNIVKICKQKIALQVTCPVTRASILSGVPLETLVLINSLEHKTKKFVSWFIERKKLRHDYNFLYYKMRTQLVESYLKNREILSLSENEFENYKKFFTKIQIPVTNISLIVERAETVIERHRFLYTKMMHREANRNIVYVGKVNIMNHKGKFSYKEDNSQIKSVFTIAASPTYGHISYIYCCGGNEQYLTNWMEDKLLRKLPPESLIIFQENVLDGLRRHSIPIDIYSTKTDMMSWLTCNNIPYDPTMHKADLYKLINDYKRSSIGKASSAEEILKAHGHYMLNKNRCNLYNNFFDPFWNFLIHELNNSSQILPRTGQHHNQYSPIITQIANVIVKNSPVEYWKSLGDMLEETEREIYREDLELEYIVDQLMTMAKHEKLEQDGDNVPLHHYSTVNEEQYIFLADTIEKLYEYNQQTTQKQDMNTI